MDITRVILYVVAIIAGGLLINIGAWLVLVRLVDRVGSKLKFHKFVAVRYLRGRFIGLLAIIGVSVSSCTLTTVLSVMGGFSDDLKQKILSTNAHIVVDAFGRDMSGLAAETDAADSTLGQMTHWRDVVSAIRQVPGVKGAAPIVQGEVMLNARTNNNSVLLKGVEPASLNSVSGVFATIEEGDVRYLLDPALLFHRTRGRKQAAAPPDDTAENDFDAPPLLPKQKVLPAIIVGRETMRSLRLMVGDEVNIISPLGDIGPTGVIPRSRPFRVGGSFFSGMYAFDERYAYTSIKDAQQFLNKGDHISEIHIAVHDPEHTESVVAAISQATGKRLRVRPWQELNAELFAALKLEKVVMFIFLSFATLVASFCIIATLTMLVLEKGAEIAVLLTIGATPKDISKIFRFEGILIGVAGSLTGLLNGFLLCMALQHIGLPIPPEVWYIDKLPVDISAVEFLAVGVASLLITTLATVHPTRVASGITPVEGLKND
ncbi:MAG: ABC transporter permease [Myxococcales bacterium]|nr:ABC transporter permease [Myxococcales bacterium]